MKRKIVNVGDASRKMMTEWSGRAGARRKKKKYKAVAEGVVGTRRGASPTENVSFHEYSKQTTEKRARVFQNRG